MMTGMQVKQLSCVDSWDSLEELLLQVTLHVHAQHDCILILNVKLMYPLFNPC